MKFKSLNCAIAMTLSCLPVIATGDFALRTNKVYHPPQIENEKLNKKVSFTFAKTKLSEILMVLSKAGNFNIVLPQGLDQELNITITDKRIIEAVKEVIEVAGYRYKFQNDTLIVSEIDVGDAEFEHVQILYNKATNITRALNDEFFKQIISVQPDTAFKPYAFTNPGQNSVTLVGNQAQLEAARKFINTLDTSRELNFYKPGFIDISDANYLISAKFENPSIEIKEVTGALALKGADSEVTAALKLLKDYDKPRKPINFYVEYLKVELGDDTEHTLKKLEQFFPIGKFQKINSSLAETPEFTSISDLLYREYSEVALIGARETKSLPGISLSARRDLLAEKQYSLTALEQQLDHIDKDDIVACLIKASNLIPDPSNLARLLKLQPENYVLILIQQQ